MNNVFQLRLLPLLLSVFYGFHSFAQTSYFEVLAHEKSRSEYPVKSSIVKYSLMRIDEPALRQYLLDAPMQFQHTGEGLPLEIPLPDGQSEVFSIEETPLLAPSVAAEHPDFKTYTGQSAKHPERLIRFSLTSVGFGGIVLHVNGNSVYFESYKRGSGLYLSYFTSDIHAPGRAPSYRCGVDSLTFNPLRPHAGEHPAEYRNNTGATLRTYQLAIAATGEFTQHPDYGNGNVNDAFAIIANYANNMAGVYETEMSVSFTLVSGANIVYSNPNTDPYNNDDQASMLDVNQTTLDNIIGTNNYDIGHVFGYTGGSGGGVASVESVCFEINKGSGVSGMCDLNFYPQAFNDQLVYHEIGHQFGMSHSYNSSIPVCTTRNAATSVEPGSGATIMSYGFTCGSDDYELNYGPVLQFHTVSYEEAYAYFTNTMPGYGGSCPTNTSTGNALPVVSVPSSKTIPKSTPFMLTGSATDANNDGLTYCWEGTNIGTSTPNSSTLNDGSKPPFFRSYDAVTTGTRIYPRLETILDQSYQGKGDKLPSVATTTTHQLTVRDNRPGGGSTVHAGVTVTIDGNSGPFFVYNVSSSFAPNASVNVSWEVAGTTAAPVSCPNVNILLSTDDGYNFPTTLAANTPNDGSQTITLPNINTTTARIKVQSSNNIFFDITNQFQIQGAILPVELLNFEVQLKNRRDALLTWQTANETGHAGFEIEMASGAGTAFQKMGFTPASATQRYAFPVPGLAEGAYLFRLKQIDTDGRFEYSPIRALRIGSDEPAITVFPNPAENMLHIALSRFGEKDITLQIVNQIGQTVRVVSAQAGTELLPVDIGDLPAGAYIISTQSAVNVENVRFVKQ